MVAVPTETVYGLAADAFNEDATRHIFKIKGRPLIDPLIVHTFDLEGVDRLASLNPAVKKLADKFWPGPLTVVLPKKREVPALVTADLDTVAVRVPMHPVLRKVLENSRLCLAAPSANPFGYLSPTRVDHVLDSLGDSLDHLLDGGPCPIGMESTIVDICDPTKPVLLRPGAINVDKLSEALDLSVEINPADKKAKTEMTEAMPAPGMIDKHYSPKTRLLILEPETLLEIAKVKHAAVIYFNRNDTPSLPKQASAYWLTEDGDLNDAARNLFHLLRAVDRKGYDAIFIEAAPEEGIGVAINDRLRRASNGK